MRDYPEWATDVGYIGHNDRWTDQSADGIDHRKEDFKEFFSKLHWQNFEQVLDDTTRLDYKVIDRWATDIVGTWRYPEELLPVSQQSGVQIEAVGTLSKQPHATKSDIKDILSRLKYLPDLIDQTIELMKRGIEEKIVQPKVIMRDVPGQISDLIHGNPMNSELLAPFKDKPAAIDQDDWKDYCESARDIYTSKLVPAFSKLKAFITDTYIPSCRETIGLSQLPNGKTWYLWKIRHHTTTMLPADQIFETGMREVARIALLMDSVRRASGFQGDMAAYLNFLRTDKQFFYTDSASLVNGYKAIAAQALKGLPTLFGHLPINQFEIKPIPLYGAPSAPTAYYEPGSLAAKRLGVYQVNTYDLPSRPKWEMQPLSLHEAVPGHHLQLSIADELPGVHVFRRHVDNTAYVEGWALYAESLGGDLGFYKAPQDKMGQLSYEMWRAIRLVVDIGMHWKNWSRQQAIDYFTANVGKASHDIESEVDRYIADPGQALAYKIGELKIKELRAFAQRELGPKFDIKAFHDKILALGAVPLDLCEQQVRSWVAEQKLKQQ
jgi:uncharacterized protein (DUF885 family)